MYVRVDLESSSPLTFFFFCPGPVLLRACGSNQCHDHDQKRSVAGRMDAGRHAAARRPGRPATTMSACLRTRTRTARRRSAALLSAKAVALAAAAACAEKIGTASLSVSQLRVQRVTSPPVDRSICVRLISDGRWMPRCGCMLGLGGRTSY